MTARMVDISVLGDKRLQRQLSRLEVQTQRKYVRQALREGGRIALRDAKQRVPVKSGRLRDSIKLRAAQGLKRGTFGVQVQTGTREELGISPTDKWYYPAALEFGHKRAPAHPYLRPAVDENRVRILNRVRRHLSSSILRHAKRGAG